MTSRLHHNGLQKLWQKRCRAETMYFYALKKEEKQTICNSLADRIGLPAAAVEKDWWMVQTLRLIFNMDVAEHLVFKGGSSLSKTWNIIERFSEDIDLALDREYLGYSGDITRTQVGKLRDKSFEYISKTFYPELKYQFTKAGFVDVRIQIEKIKSPDQDPLIIDITYPAVTDQSNYLLPKVLLEIGSRSLREPFTNRKIRSLISEHHSNKKFADVSVTIPTVNPERTFLEKLFLLHEEFQRSEEKMRVDRLSRHLYDIQRISLTKYAQKAFDDRELYGAIVTHRERFTRLQGVDYTSHYPPNLNPLPPDRLLSRWEKDYQTMQEEMIYGESLPFDQLIDEIKQLTERINHLKF